LTDAEDRSWAADRGYPLLHIYVKAEICKAGSTLGYGYRVVHFIASNGRDTVFADTTGERVVVSNEEFSIAKGLNGEHEINDNGHLLFRGSSLEPWSDWGPFENYDATVRLGPYKVERKGRPRGVTVQDMIEELSDPEDFDMDEIDLEDFDFEDFDE